MSLNHIVAFYTYRDVLTPGGVEILPLNQRTQVHYTQ